MSNLKFKGRNSNKSLGFRQWNKSKHAQYFTPIELSNAIFNGLKDNIDSLDTLNILDPTAGSGRLLLPWKRAGTRVLGIELDKESGVVLKHNIGALNTRIGDILRYYPYLDNKNFDIVISNPPFGITWDINECSNIFETANYGAKIDSLSASLEICVNCLSYNGLLIAIVPSSFYQSGKHRKTVQYMNNGMDLLARLTIDNAFKDEYGINVMVDLAIYRGNKSLDEEECDPIIKRVKNYPEITDIIRSLKLNVECYNEKIEIPDISNLIDIKISNEIEITVSGISGDVTASSLLDFYDHTLETYNPVLGCRTGIKDAYFSKANLILKGLDNSKRFLENSGFNVKINKNVKEKLARLKKKYDFLSIPVFPVKSHQLLAYFMDKSYKAKATIKDENDNVLFKKGKSYSLRPSWIRNIRVLKVEDVFDHKGKPYTKTTSLDRGYLSIKASSEQTDISFNEPDEKEIVRFIKAFGLPDIKSLDDTYPALINSYQRKIELKVPNLFDYQLADVSRLCCKPFGYLGYEMGGGKTLSSLAYCFGRGTKWNLIICQASLVDNWVNEGRKFGVEIERLTSHTTIRELKAERKSFEGRDKSHLKPKFFVTSYEFLSLDTGRIYDEWECTQTNKDGKVIHSETCRSKHCSHGHSRKFAVPSCPKCEEKRNWTGAFCRACGYRAYTYGELNQYPAYKRIKKLFSCVIVDEAQLAKNMSGRGEAVRSMHSKCKLILSGTIQRGFVTDVYHNFGWILGHSNPLFPYPRKGGSRKFLNEFGTFEFVSREFEDTLTTGNRKIIPEVSNLNRFWRILSAFTVRRLKDEMIKLPPKHRNIMILDMDRSHFAVYSEFQEWAKKQIDKELRKPETEINMGVISRCLWALRFAATAPNDIRHLSDKGPGSYISSTQYNKIMKLIVLVKEIEKKGEKVVIFSGLRSMVNNISNELERYFIRTMKITAAVSTKKRFGLISEFQNNGYTALVAGLNVINRGHTITGANHVIITDFEYQPESTDQAEDRVHRTGQTKEVFVTYLLSKNTIDESMLEINTQKREAISHSINAEAKYASTAEILKQMDNRKIELAVAKRILSQETPVPLPEQQIEDEKPDLFPKSTEQPWVEGVQLSIFS